MLIAAHRGLSGGEPENTLKAFGASVARGVEGIELDVRQTADGVLVVWHDATVAGETIADASYAHLASRAPDLCTFAETLDTIPAGCLLDVELKVSGFEAEVLRELQSKRQSTQYVVSSFRDEVVTSVKALDARTRVGLVLGRGREGRDLRERLSEFFPAGRLRRCQADLVVAEWTLLRFGFVRRMARRGWPVWVWTVNDPGLIRRLLMQRGVAAVITDHPLLAMELRAGLG